MWCIIPIPILTITIIHFPPQPLTTMVIHCMKYQKNSVHIWYNWFNWRNFWKWFAHCCLVWPGKCIQGEFLGLDCGHKVIMKTVLGVGNWCVHNSNQKQKFWLKRWFFDNTSSYWPLNGFTKQQLHTLITGYYFLAKVRSVESWNSNKLQWY